MDTKRIRVLITKVGLDGHDRGAKVISKFMRDAGMEVVYLGLFQTPEGIVQAAIEEDVDVIGLSILSGEHLTLLPEVMKLVKKRGLNDVSVVVGGIIPRRHIPQLKEAGVSEVFETGTPIDSIIKYIKESVTARHSTS
ncbi:cobalamin B12-binding domain-containing protein [Chloroflexota bacterium]